MSQSSQPFRPQNTMILMEKQAIAKIAIKQQKEVEKMLEYEL